MKTVAKTAGEPLRCLAEQALEILGLTGRELEIDLVGDTESRRCNRLYLGRDRPASVLSFGAGEGPVLGQLVINVEYAAREAGAAGYGHLYMIGYYLLHGLLHLAGYDHERGGPAAADRMARLEIVLHRLLETPAFIEED